MRMEILGPLRVVTTAGVDLTPTALQQRRLLLALLVEGGEQVSLDKLAERMWGGDKPVPQDPVKTLRTYLTRLRRLLDSDDDSGARRLLTGGPDSFGLDVRAHVLDADDFVQDVQTAVEVADADPRRAGALADRALGLWRGEALAEVHDEPWARPEITRLDELRLVAREQRLAAMLGTGRHAEAVGDLESLVMTHPLRERPHVLLLRALHRSGRSAAASAVFHAYRVRLADRAGLDPSPELVQAHDEMLAGPTAPPPETPGRGLAPLPGFPTPMVGRDEELRALASVVLPGAVVTMTGVGGAGKTRLAVELARRLRSRWADGTAFVDLGSVADAVLIPVAVLGALGLEEEPRRPPAQTLRRGVVGRSCLVLLDNAEHHIPTVSELVRLLNEATPDSTVLVTSREPLHIPQEQVWPVPPLDVTGIESAGVRLLFQRARAANPTLKEDEHLVTLAARLGGLPLAIEIIAPWTRTLSVPDILEHLGRLLDLGDASLPERQRTMDAVIASSERNLGPSARIAFRRLAVFSGDFDLRAAEAVLADAMDSETDTLQVLAGLVEASLLVAATGDGQTRYRLLEPVRRCALARLVDSGEESNARIRHLRYYVSLAERIAAHTNRADQAVWNARADADGANLRAAHDWALQTGRAEEAARLAAGLYWYWWLRATSTEGIDRLSRTLELQPPVEKAALARVGYASMLLQAGRRQAAAWQARHAVTEAVATGDPRLEALTYGTLGRMLADLGWGAEAVEALDEAEVRFRAVGNVRGLSWLAVVRFVVEDEPSMTARRLREVLPAIEEAGNRWVMAWAQGILGHLSARRGDLEDAGHRLRQACAIVGEDGFRDELAAQVHGWSAVVDARLGEPGRAVGSLEEALRVADGFPDEVPLETWTWAAAEVAYSLGDVALTRVALHAHQACRAASRGNRQRLDPERITHLRHRVASAEASSSGAGSPVRGPDLWGLLARIREAAAAVPRSRHEEGP